MKAPIVTSLVLSSICAGTAAGQQPADAPATEPLASWQIPIHAPPAEPAGPQPGRWASGPDFKASFHDGFVFYPLLGSEYDHNLPWRWTTERVSVGGVEFGSPSGDPTHWHDDWRYEYRRAEWTEAYDVRRDGVEQSFVIPAQPPGAGDLEIVGRIGSALSAAPRAPEHRPIVFADAAGRELVRYGEAFAIDAVGRRGAVSTSYDGTRVRLVVDGNWLASATFPVTVDPLTSRVRLGGASSPAAGRVHDADSVSRRSINANGLDTLVVHSREFSATDLDAHGLVTTPALANPRAIWSSITTSWSTVRPRCARSEGHWMIAWERRISSHSLVALYTHPMNSSALNSGVTHVVPLTRGRSHLRPDVGGSFTGDTPSGLVVFEDRPSGGGSGEVRGVMFDVPNRAFGPTFLIAGSPAGRTVDRRWPTVATYKYAGQWLVAWSEIRTGTSDDWDVYVNLVDFRSRVRTPHAAGPASLQSWSATEPLIDGRIEFQVSAPGHGALLAYQLTTSGTRVRTAIGYQRLDWVSSAPAPSVGPQRTLATGGFVRPVLWGLAFDTYRTSFWAMLHQEGTTLRATRVGYTGGIVESRTVHTYANGLGGAGLAHNFAHQSFTVVYSDNSFLWPLHARHFTYPLARPVPFGTSCAGSDLRENSFAPWSNAGNGNFMLVTSPASNLPTTYLVSPYRASSPVGLQGAPGCAIYIDPGLMFAIGSSTTGNIPLPLPDDPPFFGDLYCQAAILDPNANALGVTLTDALFIPVR